MNDKNPLMLAVYLLEEIGFIKQKNAVLNFKTAFF